MPPMPPTTAPAGSELLHMVQRVPVLVWVILIAALLLIARYMYLVFAASQAAGPDTQPLLAALHRALRRFGDEHGGRMPDSLDDLDVAGCEDITYRPIASLRADEKILVAHDAAPTRRVLEFPHLRPARNVLFWSGRVRLVSESAFEKLIEADDAFRARG
jgi:hypothetical protein